MTRTLINDVDILTLDPSSTSVRRGKIAIDGARILAAGDVPTDFAPQAVVDGSGHLAVPGWFNAHCHAAMTYERGWAEDLPFPRWLNERIWVAESALEPEDVYWGAALAACEMIRGGVVAFNDHYFHMDQVARVVEESGLKACLAWCVFGIGDDKEVGANLQGTLEFVDRWQGKADGRIRTALGPHSPYVCPPDLLQEVAVLARERNLAVHLHLSESEEQVRNSKEKRGASPVEHLERLGILDGHCVAAHCLVTSDSDLEILSHKDVTIAHTPITYMKLAMGACDLSRFESRGIRVAIGTDGPGSNGDMDMMAAIRQTVMLQKHERRDPAALAGDAALRMATRAGALAMGFDDSGEIAAGRAADIILLDMDKPHLLPRHDVVANVVHAAKSADVSHVWVDGRLLYENGKILTLDEERIRAKADEGARQMVSRGMQRVRTYQG